MVKLTKDFDLLIEEAQHMDKIFIILLDIFSVNSFHQLITTREELLELYLLSATSECDFDTRKENVRKCFNFGSLNKSIRNLLCSNFYDVI